MAHLDTQAFFQGNPSVNNISGFYTTRLNGVDVVSRTAFSNSIGSLSHLNVTDKITSQFDLLLELNSLNTTSCDLRVAFLVHASHTFFKRTDLNVTSVGNYFIKVIINLTGRPQAPPTYLEELHKLDNYTKAQYIPGL